MRREQFKLKLAALKAHAMSVPPGEAVLAIRVAAGELNATDVLANKLLSRVLQGLEEIAQVLSSSLSLRRAALGSSELDLDGDNWLRSIAMNTIHHLQNVLNGGIDAIANFETTMKRVNDTHPLFRSKEAMRLESRAQRRSRSRSPPTRSQQGRRHRDDSPPRRYRDDSPPRRNRRSASAPRRRETRGRSRARSPVNRDERATAAESPARERDRKRSASTPRKRRDSIDEGTDEILRAAINADKQRHPDVYPRDGKGCTNCVFLGRGSAAAATHQSYQCYSKREAMQKAAAELKSAAKRGATPKK